MSTFHFESAQDAIEYIYQSVHTHDEAITHAQIQEVYDALFDDKLIEQLNLHLTDADKTILSEHSEDEEYIENYLMQRIPNYYGMMEETVAEILADYIIDTDTEFDQNEDENSENIEE